MDLRSSLQQNVEFATTRLLPRRPPLFCLSTVRYSPIGLQPWPTHQQHRARPIKHNNKEAPGVSFIATTWDMFRISCPTWRYDYLHITPIDYLICVYKSESISRKEKMAGGRLSCLGSTRLKAERVRTGVIYCISRNKDYLLLTRSVGERERDELTNPRRGLFLWFVLRLEFLVLFKVVIDFELFFRQVHRGF